MGDKHEQNNFSDKEGADARQSRGEPHVRLKSTFISFSSGLLHAAACLRLTKI
jgi:hypothetical protein